MESLVVAADGSSLSNPGPAGWCWFVNESCWHAGGWTKGTNNQAELTAVLDLLRETREFSGPITILCDSRYVIDCCTKWMAGWKARGWKKADKKPVLNRDILEQLDKELADRDITFEWVKGHAGHDLNEAADDRARAVATAFKKGTAPDEGPGFTLSAQNAKSAEGSKGSRGSKSTVSTPVAEPHQDTTEASAESATIDTFARLEAELVSDEVRSQPDVAATYLADDFVEHGTSGAVRNRAEVLRALRPIGSPVEITPLELVALAADTYLFRWHSAVRGYGANRATIWVAGGSHGWQARFHQGTTAPVAPPSS